MQFRVFELWKAIKAAVSHKSWKVPTRRGIALKYEYKYKILIEDKMLWMQSYTWCFPDLIRDSADVMFQVIFIVNLKYKIFQKICLVLSLTRHSWVYGCLCNGHNNEYAENYGSNSKLHFRPKFGALMTSSSATFHLGWTCNNLILVTQTTYDVSVIFFNEPEKDFFEFILSSFTLSL